MSVANSDSAVEREGCRLRAVAFDFESRETGPVVLDDLRAPDPHGRYVWIDVDVSDITTVGPTLLALGFTEHETAEMFAARPCTAQTRHADGLHLELASCDLQPSNPAAGALAIERVDVMMDDRRLVTVHRGPVGFLDGIRNEYREDFTRYAKSPSFLLYELWDHLVESYALLQQRFTERVETIQRELLKEIDERSFEAVAELTTDLLRFRNAILPARSVLAELGVRKSRFVGEATQPYLLSMANTVETIAGELLTDRDVISGTLDLHMSMIAHRTNRAVKRLTGVSFVFLPLTFLCGVYGMNFRSVPELQWRWGYFLFWVAVVFITGVQLWILRRAKML